MKSVSADERSERQKSAVNCITVQDSEMQFSVVQRSAVQCSVVQ